MDTNAITQYLGNTQKWRKVLLLIREYFLFKIFGSIKKTFRLIPNNKLANKSLNRKAWVKHSTAPLARALFENGGSQNTQDEFVDRNVDTHTPATIKCRNDYELLETPNALSYTNETTHRSIFDANGFRLETHSSIRTPFPDISTLHVKTPQQIFGLTANLYGTVGMSNGNFGHWMFDGLSRAFLIQEHYSLNDFDHFLVPPRRYDFHNESLRALGIDDDRIIELPSLTPLKFERLVSTTAPRGYKSSIFPGHLIDSYRNNIKVSSKSSTANRRLYISRRDASSRNFSNEADIVSALEKEGFEEIQMSKYNFKEKIELFSSAEFIVGLSGAGLTSMIFCPAHCKVLELFPNNELSYIYASIAGHLALKYEPFIFETESTINQINRFYGEFTINTDALISTIRQM